MNKHMPEQQLQIDTVKFLNLALDPSASFFWATPNETGVSGRKGAMLGAIRKAMGVKPGFPDLMIAHEVVINPIGCELKVGRNTQTAPQKGVEAIFIRLGWPYYVCRSVQDVYEALLAEGVPMRVKRFDFGGRK